LSFSLNAEFNSCLIYFELKGAPVFHNEANTALDRDTAVISVEFTSSPHIQSVTWYKDDIPLASNWKYNSSRKV